MNKSKIIEMKYHKWFDENHTNTVVATTCDKYFKSICDPDHRKYRGGST